MKNRFVLTVGLCVITGALLVLPPSSLPKAIGEVQEYLGELKVLKVQKAQIEDYQFELSEQVERYTQMVGTKTFQTSDEIIAAVEEMPGVRIDDINTLRFANGKIYTIQKVTDRANLGKHEGLQLILTVEDVDATLESLYGLGVLFEELDVLAPSKVINLKINLYNTLGGGISG